MNQTEPTPDGGRRPKKSPNCPKCGYDVTGTNDRAERTLHYFAIRDDADGMREILQRQTQARDLLIKDRERLLRETERVAKERERLLRDWEEAKKQSPPRLGNLFGLLSPRAPILPIAPSVPEIPPSPDVNAPNPNNSFNPLIVAAINGSKNATEFLLNNGVDRTQIPLAVTKAKEFGHPEIVRLLTEHSK